MKKILSLIITTFVVMHSFAFNDFDNKAYNYELGMSLLLDSVYSDYINSSNHKVAELILDDNISSEDIDFFILANELEKIHIYPGQSCRDKYSKRISNYDHDHNGIIYYCDESIAFEMCGSDKSKFSPFGYDRYQKIRETNLRKQDILYATMGIDSELLMAYTMSKKRRKIEGTMNYRIHHKLFQ